MDSYEAKDLIGKKVIGFNLCYLDERGLRQGWLIETIEAVGKDYCSSTTTRRRASLLTTSTPPPRPKGTQTAPSDPQTAHPPDDAKADTLSDSPSNMAEQEKQAKNVGVRRFDTHVNIH